MIAPLANRAGRTDRTALPEWQRCCPSVAPVSPCATSSTRVSTRPRRILLQLSETAGKVSGTFAQSSDAIAFRQLESGNPRSVSTHQLTGTRDGQKIRMSFSNDAGGAFEVDALVNEKSIAGTYSVTYGSTKPVAGVTEKGRFEIERY